MRWLPRWRQLPELPIGLTGLNGIQIQNNLFVFGGEAKYGIKELMIIR